MSVSPEAQPSSVPAVSAATVHEAAGRTGALPSRIKPVLDAMKVHARAFTVHLPPGDNLGLHRAIYAAGAGDVLVAAAHGGAEFGYWGEILNEAAIARGLAGLIIDGGVRDVERLRAMSLPVFAANICVRGTIKDPLAATVVGAVLRIGDVTVRTGDLVVGDADGVVVVPSADEALVLQAAAERDEHEATIMARIRDGASTLELFGLDAGDRP